MRQRSGEGGEQAVTQQAAIREQVATIAVSMQDIAQTLRKSKEAKAEWERLVATQEEKEPSALAVPTGKPLSIFDSTALPAAYTEFLFGDCVPFLKRDTPLTCQQIFDALPRREEQCGFNPHRRKRKGTHCSSTSDVLHGHAAFN